MHKGDLSLYGKTLISEPSQNLFMTRAVGMRVLRGRIHSKLDMSESTGGSLQFIMLYRSEFLKFFLAEPMAPETTRKGMLQSYLCGGL